MEERNKQSLKRIGIFFTIIVLIYVIQAYLIDEPIINYLLNKAHQFKMFLLKHAKTTSLIISLVFTYFTSVFEGYFYTHKAASNFKDKTNLHPLFVVIRSCLWLSLWLISDINTVLTCIFIFPFLHDGIYYTTREMLVHGIYKKKFFDQSTTSTAFSTRFFTPLVRTILAIVGILYFIITY